MDPRQQLQALQTHITSARAALDGGDRAAALEHVDAALAIDPDFLAAQTLRERLTTSVVELPAAIAPPVTSTVEDAAPTARPLVSAEGYAKFEQRAKRRRVDRRMDAARAALQSGRLREAAAALDEVIELDANLPELSVLTAEFDDLRRTIATPHRGRWLAAAGVFTATIFGLTWPHGSGVFPSRGALEGVPRVAAPVAEGVVAKNPVETVVATAGESSRGAVASTEGDSEGREVEVRSAAAAATAQAFASQGSSDVPVAPPRAAILEPRTNVSDLKAEVEPATATIDPPESSAPSPEPAAPAPEPAVAVAVAAPPPAVSPPAPTAPVAPAIDDELLIKQTLQRYRRAYAGLDAHSARAVYPAVNEVALARAFDGLSSQNLTFDACDVRLRDRAATATCRGSASYVPKIGSREPHVESRVWNFHLVKLGSDWQIETARAEK